MLSDTSEVFTVVVGVFVDIACKNYGWNRHIWDIPPAKLPSKFECSISFGLEEEDYAHTMS